METKKLRFVFEYDGKGCFQFVERESGQVSSPATYSGIAAMSIDKRKFIGVSEYYAGNVPTSKVIEIIEQETEVKTDAKVIDFGFPQKVL